MMESSIIRSAISLDSSRDHKAEMMTDREDELNGELGRLMRRNALLEKSKKVMEEELMLYKEEIASKNRKIEQLYIKASRITQAQSIMPTPKASPCLQVILCEKEEQLAMVSQAFASKQKELEEAREEVRSLRSELQAKSNMLHYLKESARAQIDNQANQIAELSHRIEEKNKEATSIKLLYENLIQKENLKWQRVNDRLKEQLRAYEEEDDVTTVREEGLKKEVQLLRERNEDLQEEKANLEERIEWLRGLLEEAKGEFINAQLKQVQHYQKEEREKREQERLNRLLKPKLKFHIKNSNKRNESSIYTVAQPANAYPLL